MAGFSDYDASFTFDRDGSPLSSGSPADRTFATEEYDVYFQDIWKPFNNLTLTLGLRYGMSRPVYEKNGFQVRPDRPLGLFLEQRIASAAQGIPLNDLINFELAGPANNAEGFYPMDWNNFSAICFAVAWSPSFSKDFLKKLFGAEGESTFRGGFRIINDFFGQQLAVSFDRLSQIGFTAQDQISANTYNVTDRLAPLFTGFGQDIATLPNLSAPTQIFNFPADRQERIQTSLDTNLTSPINYSWNVSYGRSLPKGMYFEANYVGRAARNLLGARDVMALNNLVDPVSGMDWYTAAGMLVDLNNARTLNANVTPIPYFENLFPGAVGFFGAPGTTATQGVYNLFSQVDGFGVNDWTFIQSFIEDGLGTQDAFFHPQYAALTAFGTIASSDYHGASFSLRQRLGEWLSYDINYTFSKSMDDVSGLQTGNTFGSAFYLKSDQT